MGFFKTRAVYGTYQNFNNTFTSFSGAEARHSIEGGYIGLGMSVATDDMKSHYGLLDVKGKLNYDSSGTFEQNLRIRTAVDKEPKSTQIRYSPLTVNIDLTDNVSIYSNTHYSGKYNFDSGKWDHSAGNFTGVSWDIDKKNNLSVEAQRYNIQDFTNNSSENWSVNLMYTYKF